MLSAVVRCHVCGHAVPHGPRCPECNQQLAEWAMCHEQPPPAEMRYIAQCSVRMREDADRVARHRRPT